ncbi:histidine kinase [Spirosoma sp. HMF3257]|uniref:histidine kinase n=1 Tax=Spirosoma telluris TaxID=2183553 RepID=A0A327NQ58_9BACT|nr:histidine kinase [Spirosoma telluris]RAI77337.1 histidine kinase [Spirosoma telluris]
MFALGSSYYRLADYEQALKYLQQASKKQGSLIASEKLRTKRSSFAMEGTQAYNLYLLGAIYRRIGQYDQASDVLQQALGYASQVPKQDFLKLVIESLQVDTYGRQGNPKTFAEGHRVLALAKKAGNNRAVNYSVMGLGWYFLGVGQADSAVYYGRQSLAILEKPDLLALRDANELLAQAYAQQKAYEKAYQYQTRFMAYRDTLNNEAVAQKAAVIQYSDQMSRQQDQIALLTKDKQLQTEMVRRMALSQQAKATQLRYELDRNQSQITLLNKDKQLQIETTRRRELLRQAEAARLQNQMAEQQAETRRQRLLLLSSLAVLALLVGLAAVLYRNNRNKQQANALLQAQRDQLNQALTELKATQTQLIQKEKMASLGELTAGIAHEIQNPLNFVNNFSEVSAELVTELEEEQLKPDRDTDLEAELLGDLKQNLQKIHHHGGRASAIVKGMLEHARTETGEKRPTDLNALADEYLKISFQGQRAKDKDFNAELHTDFGPKVGLIEVAPQEIGRVLLNLYNNAFYAVREKQKSAPATYQPTVTVSTYQFNGHVEIRVSDNGTGIADVVKAKIFQPFFTTKPTGEGTGLGLSLSYDIVTKGHGGTLRVDSQVGEGTAFFMELPQR